MRHRLAAIAFLLFTCAYPAFAQKAILQPDAQQFHDPALLSFDELVALSGSAKPNGQLAVRLESLLTTPFVHNDASATGIEPHRPTVENLGPVVRVGFWNIERGLNFELIRGALTNTDDFERLVGDRSRISEGRKALIESQLHDLQNADVLVLNEADIGMKRTEYRDVGRELAAALHMNYAYGVEFIEVDPIFALGTEKAHLRNPQQDERLRQDLQVDQRRYRGLHGTAILSRYPIRSARILRLPVCYDWYGKEAKEAAKLEKGKRWAANRLFRERIEREVRHGGRMALIVDLAVPDSPTGEATVVATHLENRCAPSCRNRQMAALLATIKEDGNPLVMAGDLNTTGKNNIPTSVRNEIMTRVADYKFWAGLTVSHFNPLGVYKLALYPAHYFHGYNDPTALNVPILWEHRERSLFKRVEKFRFADGRAFDFRGAAARSLNGRSRTLSDSNQRAGKGFVPTYSFSRDYWGVVGRFKLDWLFVAPYAEDPHAPGRSDLLAPHFARTLRELNDSVDERLSDHAPMIVDLPFSITRLGEDVDETADACALNDGTPPFCFSEKPASSAP